MVLLLKIQKVRRRYSHPAFPLSFVDAHDSIGICVGQWTKQHSVQDAEDGAVGADAKRQRVEGIVTRYGFFYGPGTWFSPDGDVAQQVRQQQFPIVGNGEGVWSWLHIDDAAIATAAAAERGNPGIYLIVNDQPLAVREWLPAFAQWVNAPPPPQLSVEDALEVGGADAVYYGTQMRGVSNAKAKRELDFKPRRLEWIRDTAAAHTS